MQSNSRGTSGAAPGLGRAAVAAAVAGTAVAPVHALSRYATADGRADLDSPLVRWWAEPAAEWLAPLLTWSGPDTVYLTYGKLWLPVLALTTAAAVGVRRGRQPRGLERMAWPVALAGLVLLTASTFGTYWTPWLEHSFLFLGVPGLLVGLLGGSLLGVALLRRRFRPRATGWLLALWVPAFVGLSSVLAFGAGLLPMVWAWALAGRVPAGCRVPVAAAPAGATAGV